MLNISRLLIYLSLFDKENKIDEEIIITEIIEENSSELKNWNQKTLKSSKTVFLKIFTAIVIVHDTQTHNHIHIHTSLRYH